jgi:hypothetical protein
VNEWVKLYRRMVDWEWYKDANTARVFIHCLLKANWKDGRFMGHEIPRGSFVTSIKQLSIELRLSQRNVRTAINHLKSTNELTIKATKRFTIVEVLKYSLYQSNEEQSDKQNDKVSDTQMTNSRQTGDKQVTTIEEVKKLRREEPKKTDAVLTDLDRAIIDYQEYRRKVRKPMTDKAVKLMYSELDKLASDDRTKIAILEQSIVNGWTGIFPLKNPLPATTQQPQMYRTVTMEDLE